MNTAYRNVAIAAGGALAVAMATRVIRRAVRPASTAQVLTVSLDAERVLDALSDGSILAQSLQLNGDVLIDTSAGGRTIEWFRNGSSERGGHLELIPAPGDRGTELHVTMRQEKYTVKDVVRRIKAYLETGEVPTGKRYTE